MTFVRTLVLFVLCAAAAPAAFAEDPRHEDAVAQLTAQEIAYHFSGVDLI